MSPSKGNVQCGQMHKDRKQTSGCRGFRRGSNEDRLLHGHRLPSGVMKTFWNCIERWLYNTVNVLNAT